MNSQRLIIFTRYPEPGTTKTRLIPALGTEGAARLQCDLTRHALAQAREFQRSATDGGYYLIGLRQPVPGLFHAIAWGGEQVLQSTLDRAAGLSRTVSLLEPLSDVDRPEDLPVWCRVRQADSSTIPAISVIVPTLDEARYLPRALSNAVSVSGVEVIVADGGSTDATTDIAEEAGCRVLRCAARRARQVNAGAEAARGDILLFLHADSRLPEGFAEAVHEALNRPRVAAGAFRLRIDGPERALRLMEWGVRVRSRLFQMPYGDQALFMKAERFRAVGGFPDVPIMDDFMLVRRLRRLGRIVVLPDPVVTSARRWHALGPWRTMWINQKVILGYCFGVSPERLAEWYTAQDESRVQ